MLTGTLISAEAGRLLCLERHQRGIAEKATKLDQLEVANFVLWPKRNGKASRAFAVTGGRRGLESNREMEWFGWFILSASMVGGI